MIEEFPGDFFQWLRGFYCVAKQGSMINAVRVMGRQQPTISHHIKCLERELGTKLFDRSSGKMELTPDGRVVLQKAISIFQDIEEIRNEFREENRVYQGKIAISATFTIINSFLPKHIRDFMTAHPLIQFHLHGALFNVVIEKVDSGEVDLGIGYMDSLPTSIVPYELFKTKTVLIAPKNHSFFTGDNPTLEQIARCPLILFSQTGDLESYIVERFARDQLKPNVILTHNNVHSVKTYIKQGLGISISVGYTISDEDKKFFQIIPLDKYFQDRVYYLFLRRRKYHSPAIKAFIREIKPDLKL